MQGKISRFEVQLIGINYRSLFYFVVELLGQKYLQAINYAEAIG